MVSGAASQLVHSVITAEEERAHGNQLHKPRPALAKFSSSRVMVVMELWHVVLCTHMNMLEETKATACFVLGI